MAKHYEMTWNHQELLLQVENLAIEEIDRVAAQIGTNSEEPVDTGFLAASFYINSSSGLNTFNEIWTPGHYMNREGYDVWRDHIEMPEAPPKGGAVAAWAADYAIWVEERTSFIYNAIMETARQNGV